MAIKIGNCKVVMINVKSFYLTHICQKLKILRFFAASYKLMLFRFKQHICNNFFNFCVVILKIRAVLCIGRLANPLAFIAYLYSLACRAFLLSSGAI